NTIHNLYYYQKLMQGLRDAIAENALDAFVAEFYAGIGQEVPDLEGLAN
ncbi:MAG TPA: tRNA guanosine(34) transglycosylase Tgt, partial [Thiomicrospira sp.]|nr:tRNA guanosine(34) transglycosylase Tgt [Thiomicrospira sp.]